MTHDCSNVLGRRATLPGVIERVNLVCEEAKSNVGGYLETIGERTDLALHTGVIVQRVPVEITKLRGIPFQSGASKRGGNIGFYQGGSLEGD